MNGATRFCVLALSVLSVLAAPFSLLAQHSPPVDPLPYHPAEVPDVKMLPIDMSSLVVKVFVLAVVIFILCTVVGLGWHLYDEGKKSVSKSVRP